MGGGGGGVINDFDASERFASVGRNAWNWDKKNLVIPYQTRLTAETLGNAPTLQAVGFAKNAVNQAFNTSAGAQSRDLARMGVMPTATQRMEMNLQNSADRASLLAATENAARLQVKDRNLQTLAGGMGGIGGMASLTKGAQ